MSRKPIPNLRPGDMARPGTPRPDEVTARSRSPAYAGGDAEQTEAGSAGLVVQALIKADRAFAIYLPNNPLHKKFFEDFRRRCEEHLAEFGPLLLELTHNSIICAGETIYTNDDLRENLAFRMYADGLRVLKIEDDVEPGDLHTLVEILGRPTTEEDEDDIVTRLWSADLPQVKYVVVEPPPEGGTAALAPPTSRTNQEGALRRYTVELAVAPPPPPPLPPAQQVFSLSEEELAALHELLARDEQRSPLEQMVEILEAIVAAERDAAMLEEFLEIIARLCGDFMSSGRVDLAIELLSVLSRAAARPGLPTESLAKIESARERVITADVVAALSRLLSTGDGISHGLLRPLLAGLGRSAIEPFCQILGEVRSKETRKALIDALSEAGRGSAELFLPFLLDPRWYLVRNTIYILRRIAGPEAARAVARCANHADSRVRKEAILFFDETGDPVGEPVLLARLGDEAQTLRVAAARGLARHGSRAAAERLLSMIAAPAFAEREQVEREAVWEALGALAPGRAFPLLKKMLLKRRWFGQSKELDDIACACAGLKRIGTPEAIESLKAAAADKRGEARELIEKTLRSLAQARGPGGRAGDEGDAEANRG